MHSIFRYSALCILIVGASLMAAVAAFAAPTAKPVIGGTNASKTYPWMAALLQSDQDDSTEAQVCGASLIAPQYLATAAHCASYFGEAVDPGSLEVMLGENQLPFGRGNRKAIIGVFIHPEYNPITLENDVALLKLAEPVTNRFLRVLQPGEENQVKEGIKAKLLGWGLTHPTLPILPAYLQEVKIPIHADTLCLSSIGRWFKPLSMLCAGILSSSSSKIDGKDACFGDSGGPLVVSTSDGEALAATVSWGLGCANSLTYGVYADVIQLSTFLNSRPVARPLAKGSVSVQGSGIVGEPLRCDDSALVLSGDAVDSKKYSWSISFDDAYFPVSESQEYVPADADADGYITCKVILSNAGGDTLVDSDNGVTVFPPEATPEPTATPDPVATGSTDTVSDRSAPIIKIAGKKCSRHRCKVTVDAQDDSGVAGVEAFYNKQVKASRNCKGSGCVKTSSGTLAAVSRGNGLWDFVLTAPRRGTLKVQLQVSAVDQVGNLNQSGASTVLSYHFSN